MTAKSYWPSRTWRASFVAQASVLEIHAWGATLGNVEKPDGITFDWIPTTSWNDGRGGRRFRGERPLGQSGIEQFREDNGRQMPPRPCATKPHADWAAAKEFARALAQAMSKDSSRKYLATASKQARERAHFCGLSPQCSGCHSGRRLFGAGASWRHCVDTPRSGRNRGQTSIQVDLPFQICCTVFRAATILGRCAQSCQALAVQAALREGNDARIEALPRHAHQRSSTTRSC